MTWARVQRAVGGTDTVYRVGGEMDRIAQPMDLQPDEWSVLSALSERRSLGELCRSSKLPDFQVCQLVWAFYTLGLLRPGVASGLRLDLPLDEFCTTGAAFLFCLAGSASTRQSSPLKPRPTLLLTHSLA